MDRKDFVKKTIYENFKKVYGDDVNVYFTDKQKLDKYALVIKDYGIANFDLMNNGDTFYDVNLKVLFIKTNNKIVTLKISESDLIKI